MTSKNLVFLLLSAVLLATSLSCKRAIEPTPLDETIVYPVQNESLLDLEEEVIPEFIEPSAETAPTARSNLDEDWLALTDPSATVAQSFSAALNLIHHLLDRDHRHQAEVLFNQLLAQAASQEPDSANEQNGSAHYLAQLQQSLPRFQVHRSEPLFSQNQLDEWKNDPRALLTQARLLIASGEPHNAVRLLRTIRIQDRYWERQRLWLLALAFYQQDQSAQAALPLFNLGNDRASEPRDQQLYTWLAWQCLTRSQPEELRVLLSKPLNDELRGWLELAVISVQNYASSEEMIHARLRWAAQWLNHPAGQTLIMDGVTPILEQPDQIALLLPTSHPKLATVTEYFQKGFFAAFEQDLLPKPSRIDVIDITESQGGLLDTYKDLVDAQYDLVIGPLGREYSKELSRLRSWPIPTLLLGTHLISNQSDTQNLWQFGLSPEEQGVSIARKLIQDHHTQVLNLNTNRQHDVRFERAFSTEFSALGGTLFESAFCQPSSNNICRREIVNAFRNNLQDGHRQKLSRMIGAFKHEHRRESRVDAVALNSAYNQAKLMRPQISLRISHEIPVYASVFDLSQDHRLRLRDHDFEGMHVEISPWRARITELDKQHYFHYQAPEIPEESFFQELYALGIDTYHLHRWLQLIKNQPGRHYLGNLGNLVMDALSAPSLILMEGHWHEYINGEIHAEPLYFPRPQY